MTKKVMVAMSGGVDSSAAAFLLKQQGCEIIGATLKLIADSMVAGNDVRTRTCCSLDDVADARSIAHLLGFKHYVFNMGSLFEQAVIRRFADSYSKGETPNPCIDCNRFIKFSKMLERARMLDFDYIATGHYARTAYDETTGRYLLKKARDATKDQTYVLYALTQDELAHTLFPLGDMTKDEVRAMAEQNNLINARKPDSQDICFVPDGDYAAFLKTVLGIRSEPGNFVDKNGKILGRHKGLVHYTIGQRKGLGLSFDRPQYVIRKDAVSNLVVLGDESELMQKQFRVGDLNWISIGQLDGPLAVAVKIRYSQQEVPATLLPVGDEQVQVAFDQPQRAVTPGQAAVFYLGDTVVGGGIILADPR